MAALQQEGFKLCQVQGRGGDFGFCGVSGMFSGSRGNSFRGKASGL